MTVVTTLFYLLAAYTNPGYIIGNEEIQLAKAQDFDLKHNHQASGQGYQPKNQHNFNYAPCQEGGTANGQMTDAQMGPNGLQSAHMK